MSEDQTITLRPATSDDEPFLRRVYADTRAAELALTDWTAEQKQAFCDAQFTAQDAYYREHFPDCEFLVVERASEPVGRLYRDRRDDEIRVVDIALLADARGQGIGSRLMEEILVEAAAAGIRVRIHVERNNPARHLYDRLGFRVEEEGNVYDLLIWEKEI